MIERINLIEKEPFQFSYQKLTQGITVLVGLCVLLYGVQYLRVTFLERQITSYKEETAVLRQEYIRLIKAAPPKLDGGPHAELTNIFTQTPPWASLIRDLANRLPDTVWLTSLKAMSPYSVPAETTAKSNSKNKDKEAAQTQQQTKGLLLKGTARTVSDIAAFIEALQKSPYVTRSALTSSQRKEDGFSFAIECDIMPGPQ